MQTSPPRRAAQRPASGDASGFAPDFSHEALARDQLVREIGGTAARDALICGIDEAGRGPLAGPVVAAAIVLPASDAQRASLDLEGLADSKKLSPAKRDALFVALRRAAQTGLVEIGVGAASAREIDALNILRANDLAMRRAVARLSRRPAIALVDGNRAPPDLGCQAQPLVKGDARSLSIAAASIVAKVIRDRAMRRLAHRHPAYGWERNAGYPTQAHRAALMSNGPCAHHRESFSVVRIAAQKRSLGA